MQSVEKLPITNSDGRKIYERLGIKSLNHGFDGGEVKW